MLSLHPTPATFRTDVDSFQRASILSLAVTLATYRQIQESIISAARRGESRVACFANVHMTVEAASNPAFAAVVNGADWVTTDGVPLTWVLRQQLGIQQERTAGIDMLPSVIQRAAEEGLSVFFYGSTPAVLASVEAICQDRYPTLKIAGTLSPPFRPLTSEEEDHMIDRINQSGAKLVFVALGCPKQERWMAKNRGRVQAVMLGIGAALPILAGLQSRSPRWMQRAGLEWSYRLAVEPRRLFKRYALTNSRFMVAVARQAFRRN